MRLKCFWIPVRDSGAAEPEVNALLAQHRVVSLEKAFVAEGTNRGWSVCVAWVPYVVSAAAGSTGSSRVSNAAAGPCSLYCR
jgi:hypothetical protein